MDAGRDERDVLRHGLREVTQTVWLLLCAICFVLGMLVESAANVIG